MVIDVPSTTGRPQADERPWADDAAYRLAAVVAADPTVRAVTPTASATDLGELAAAMEPIVAWARSVVDDADDTAVRRGVHVAATRALLGVPRWAILVAFHELPVTLRSETPAPSRLEHLSIEVGLRLRRLPARWDGVAPD